MTAKTDAAPVARKPVGGFRRGTAVVYRYLQGLFVLGVLVQVYLAGVGAFGMHGTDASHAKSFDPHRGWGTVLMLLSLLLLIIALIAWENAATVIGAFVLALLAIVAQNVLAAFGDSDKWVGGAHALDGIFILLLSVWLAYSARKRALARAKGG